VTSNNVRWLQIEVHEADLVYCVHTDENLSNDVTDLVNAESAFRLDRTVQLVEIAVQILEHETYDVIPVEMVDHFNDVFVPKKRRMKQSIHFICEV